MEIRGFKVKNRDLLVFERYLAVQRGRARSLISDEIIEEHKHHPLGKQSDRLARLMFILSSGPHAGKYAIRVIEPFKAYKIVSLTGKRGVPPEVVDATVYASPDLAYHAIFLRRIADLGI